ncbi:MAG: DUF4886 domain-containing protein [Clostridia bacterium]|nr:DUF4886 domain-containing protein [Clostridia bacterium]
MKILSIGNSFSADAHAYLYQLAKQRNIDLETVNLAIGGCSLQRHWENVENNNSNYGHSINGGDWENKDVTIDEIIKNDKFDVVTLQQVSHFSGQYETYQPYLDNLVEYVIKHQPSTELYFHSTWAYEIDSDHEFFSIYDYDQKKMYSAALQAAELACKATNAKIIPSGKVIQMLRERLPQFDYSNGGESLCRDGFHMSLTYGRYALALTWLVALTGIKAEPLPFMDLDIKTIAQICDIVNEIVGV